MVFPQTEYVTKLIAKQPMKMAVQSHINTRFPDSLCNSICEHQNPPSPADIRKNDRTDDASGVELNAPLIIASSKRTRDTIKWEGFITAPTVLAAASAVIRLMAHINPP